MSRKDFLGTEPVNKTLISLSVPAFTGMFITVFYNIVDTIFIGRYIGSVGIAATSIVFPLQMMMMACGLMIGMGGASIVSRCLGKKDMDRAEKAYGNVVTLCIAIGLFITFVGLLNIDYFVYLFGSTDTIFPYAKDYMEIILLGGVFAIFAMESNNIIRAEGNAMVAMKTMLLGGVINLILDPILIFVLDMGMKGAAWATVIARVIQAVYVMYYFLGGHSVLKFRLNSLIPDISIVKEIFYVGISSFSRAASSSFIVILLNRMLGFYGGDVVIAIFGIINRMIRFVFMPVMAIGQGLQPLLGFNYGAGKMNRAKEAINLSLLYSTAFCVVMSLFIFLKPDWIIGLFTTEKKLLLEGAGVIRTVMAAVIFTGFQFIGSTVFQSIGKGLPAFFLSLTKSVIFFIPLLFLFSYMWKLNGIWLTFPVADVLSFIVTLCFLLPQIRALNKEEGGVIYG